MDDYGSSAALGFIQGSIIGDGIVRATQSYRNGLAVRREFMELEQDYDNLRAQYIRLRNHAIDLDVAVQKKDAEVAQREAVIAIRDVKIAQGKHEIALRDHEIALRDHEIALRDHEIALLTQKLHQTEDRLDHEKDSHACTVHAWKNLIYAFNHYRRLLKIPEQGGDAYDCAWESWWDPILVPPDQRSEPKK
ncbi:MAG: hypothetical protein PHT60_14885 [Acidiphilium sp.]|nr:hypothetical protein [Acidiphilium sp.]MDD4937047.1 hypothetical protein [Acidiphilium sp.]